MKLSESQQQKAVEILERLANPERFVENYETWFSGDGPFEDYCVELAEQASALLFEIKIPVDNRPAKPQS